MSCNDHLVNEDLNKIYIEDNAEIFSKEVSYKCGTLNNFVGFIVGTALRSSKPVGSMEERVVYNFK